MLLSLEGSITSLVRVELSPVAGSEPVHSFICSSLYIC